MNTSQPIKSPKVELTRPKRPLSAYNLYYRFKRQKVVDALAASGGAMDKAAIRHLVEAPPGLENSQSALGISHVSDELRRERIVRGLEGRTEARDTSARSHRRNRGAMNGGMGFVELASLMKTGWAECDDFAQGVFKGLAEEGRKRYRRVLLEYKFELNRLGLTEEDPEMNKKKQVKKKRVEKSRPATKRKVAEISRSSRDDASAESVGDAEKEAAEIMIQLTNTSPTRGNTSNSLARKGFDREAAPACLPDPLSKQDAAVFARLDLLSKQVAPAVDGIEDHKSIMADSPRAPPAAHGSSPQNPAQIGPRSTAPPLEPPFQARARTVSPTCPPKRDAIASELERELMLRVRKMEAQLAEQRARSRIRELECEMARRGVGEGLPRTAPGNVILHEGSVVVSGPDTLLQGDLARAYLARTAFNSPILTQPHFVQSEVRQDTAGEAGTGRAGTGQIHSFQSISAQGEEAMPGTALEDSNGQNDVAFPTSQNPLTSNASDGRP